ncbi:hypothetical protein ACF3M1_14980 [Luteimonas sp. WGS1318]|uniref:hypothetical protein n=1 Tax=Luteimonas sp. WGS1318 TaxID=3366815 RepID=UPI00372D7DDD
MRRTTPKGRVTGLYIAIALIAYALAGDVFNDLYLPGRRRGGLHLHNEAIPPAVLAILLIAAKFLVDAFGPFPRERLVHRSLTILAVLAFGGSFYLIGNPSGRTFATVEECQATYTKLAALMDEATGDMTFHDHVVSLQATCTDQPMLRTYQRCVADASRPADINGCESQARRLSERDNATSARRRRASGVVGTD